MDPRGAFPNTIKILFIGTEIKEIQDPIFDNPANYTKYVDGHGEQKTVTYADGTRKVWWLSSVCDGMLLQSGPANIKATCTDVFVIAYDATCDFIPRRIMFLRAFLPQDSHIILVCTNHAPGTAMSKANVDAFAAANKFVHLDCTPLANQIGNKYAPLEQHLRDYTGSPVKM